MSKSLTPPPVAAAQYRGKSVSKTRKRGADAGLTHGNVPLEVLGGDEPKTPPPVNHSTKRTKQNGNTPMKGDVYVDNETMADGTKDREDSLEKYIANVSAAIRMEGLDENNQDINNEVKNSNEGNDTKARDDNSN